MPAPVTATGDTDGLPTAVSPQAARHAARENRAEAAHDAPSAKQRKKAEPKERGIAHWNEVEIWVEPLRSNDLRLCLL